MLVYPVTDDSALIKALLFLTVCLVWVCVFFNLYPFLEIFFISKSLFCQIEGFLFDIHTAVLFLLFYFLFVF